MKQILTLIVIFLSVVVSAQNIHFIKTYGNSGYDYGRDIKQDIDTGYIATGSSSSFSSGTADAFLLKVDSLGNFKWSYNYGGSGADWGESVVVLEEGGYAIGGYTNSFGEGGFDFYLVKTEEDGTPIWQKSYGGSDWDKAHSIAQIPADSGFILVGETYSYGMGNSDVYMVRTDQDGDTLWTKTYGGIQSDYANAVLVDGDSIVVVGGTKSFGSGMTDGIILKYHIDGTFGWVKYVGQFEDDYFTSITMRYDYYVVGGTRSYNHEASCDCGYDFWMYKIEKDGILIGDTTWNGEQLGVDIVYDVETSPLNDIFYAGSTTSWGASDIADGISDAFINKLFSNYYSAYDYIKNFGFNGNDVVYALDFCYDEGIVGIGDMYYTSTGGNNMFIVRVDRSNSFGFIDLTTDLVSDIITLSYQELVENSIKVYPTLFYTEIFIEGMPENSSINIYDIQGKIVYSSQNDQNTLHLENLTPGLYFLEIIDPDKNRTITKIVKG